MRLPLSEHLAPAALLGCRMHRVDPADEDRAVPQGGGAGAGAGGVDGGGAHAGDVLRGLLRVPQHLHHQSHNGVSKGLCIFLGGEGGGTTVAYAVTLRAIYAAPSAPTHRSKEEGGPTGNCRVEPQNAGGWDKVR